MAKDSGLWESAYLSYRDRFPESKFNDKNIRIKKKAWLEKEPMILQEEYNEIMKKLKALNKRRTQIKKEMQLYGASPINRAAFFERPILLYALKLEHGCWYVGMSRNVDRRLKAHKKGNTIWTKLHPPIEIFEVRETGLNSDSEASILENELTFDYARMYSPEKVRGGGYCQLKPRWPSELLE